jgi:hypothetical protein
MRSGQTRFLGGKVVHTCAGGEHGVSTPEYQKAVDRRVSPFPCGCDRPVPQDQTVVVELNAKKEQGKRDSVERTRRDRKGWMGESDDTKLRK